MAGSSVIYLVATATTELQWRNWRATRTSVSLSARVAKHPDKNLWATRACSSMAAFLRSYLTCSTEMFQIRQWLKIDKKLTIIRSRKQGEKRTLSEKDPASHLVIRKTEVQQEHVPKTLQKSPLSTTEMPHKSPFRQKCQKKTGKLQKQKEAVHWDAKQYEVPEVDVEATPGTEVPATTTGSVMPPLSRWKR